MKVINQNLYLPRANHSGHIVLGLSSCLSANFNLTCIFWLVQEWKYFVCITPGLSTLKWLHLWSLCDLDLGNPVDPFGHIMFHKDILSLVFYFGTKVTKLAVWLHYRFIEKSCLKPKGRLFLNLHFDMAVAVFSVGCSHRGELGALDNLKNGRCSVSNVYKIISSPRRWVS